jgi:bacterioferritin-associated ferredoxin
MGINCIFQFLLIPFSASAVRLNHIKIMIICLCNPVTESQIRICATAGCGSFREMATKLGVAQQCGRCACMAKEVFDAARAGSQVSERAGITIAA